ncbi:MAG TPA: 50S ribosomal protein L18 [Deltaproteobacteria bacterium]|nr:MAG: 50S ribosomal protein L18 [Deltaproteobacteria bacterium GWA2_55_82]OGQ65165.1 MAG: 50S ribosomal protein L18 [Deltaproteobacteria bacterium RIFCSPLOWO2_02_FULL_55_12]OIJ74709.1 MAG: 50S ribosomal protein L18 [Deltaproteobacteria bacterium GWC2_55_46]HBG45631.1 50S ribosomal protein L18 [Deltaproteobacteria bacterium]HCY12176.1 50S ribosomal protein L18 [Deltaproteobacteria bacterium]
MNGRVLKQSGWERRKARVRKKIKGTAERPRLNVRRSNKHIYAQIIDDTTGKTLAAASTKMKELEGADGKKIDAAKKVGQTIGKIAADKGIEKVVFDRSGYIYHGRVKALAEGAREAGLKF